MIGQELRWSREATGLWLEQVALLDAFRVEVQSGQLWMTHGCGWELPLGDGDSERVGMLVGEAENHYENGCGVVGTHSLPPAQPEPKCPAVLSAGSPEWSVAKTCTARAGHLGFHRNGTGWWRAT